MAVPDFQSLMLPVLRAVADGQISAIEMRDRVAGGIGLTEGELAERLPKGGQTVFANRIAWANTYLQRAGLIEKIGRGVYRRDLGRDGHPPVESFRLEPGDLARDAVRLRSLAGARPHGRNRGAPLRTRVA
jgi:restriction endonuclease Mrr